MNNDQLYYHCRNIHYSHSHSCSSAFYFIFFRWYCCCYVLSSSTLYSRRDLFLLTQYYFWAQHRTRTKKYVTNPESTRPISIKKKKKKTSHIIIIVNYSFVNWMACEMYLCIQCCCRCVNGNVMYMWLHCALSVSKWLFRMGIWAWMKCAATSADAFRPMIDTWCYLQLNNHSAKWEICKFSNGRTIARIFASIHAQNSN